MSTHLDKVLNIVREALESRGFSKGEADQILTRIQTGVEIDEIGDTYLPFGKYKGQPIKDVRPSYLWWLTTQDWFIDKWGGLYERIQIYLKSVHGGKVDDDDIPF